MKLRGLVFASVLVLSTTGVGAILVTPATAKHKPPPPPPPPSTSSTYVTRYADIVDGVACDVTPEAVRATSDGGSVLLALSSASSILSSDSCRGVNWLVKLDPTGKPQWQKLVGCFGLPPGGYSYGLSLQQTTDGGYVVAGGTVNCAPETVCPSQCALAEKLDAAGNLVWAHFYSSGAGDRESTIQQIRQTGDGGFVAGGLFRDADSNLGAWILALDAAGSVRWQRKIGPGGPSGSGQTHVYVNDVRQTADGGYVAAGEFTSYLRTSSGDTGVLVVRLDAAGNVLWQRAFDSFDANGVPTASEHALSISQTSDGGYVLAGNWRTTGPNTCCQGALLLKLDASGNSQWQKAYSGGVYCFFNGYSTTCYAIGATAYSVHQTADGGYLLAGDGDLLLLDSVPPVPWLAKVDASGNLVWQHFYYESHPTTGRPLSEYFASADVTSAGGFLALGFTSSPSADRDELFAVKTDADGLVGACTQIHPATPLDVLDPGLTAFAPNLPVQATTSAQGDLPSTTQANSIGSAGGGC